MLRITRRVYFALAGIVLGHEGTSDCTLALYLRDPGFAVKPLTFGQWIEPLEEGREFRSPSTML